MADEPTTETPATPTAEPTPPASADAALDAVLGKSEATPEPETPAAEDAAPAEAPTETPAEETPAPDRDALTRAMGALRRDNVPDAVIEHWMQNDPEKLLAWADKASKRQGDIDKRLRGEKPTELEAKDTPEEPKADPTGQPATDEALADLVRPFAEEMGSEHAQEALTKLAGHVRESTLAEVRPVLETFQRHMAVMSSMLEATALREARAGLRERFPQVAEDAVWSKILERAKTLSGTGGYEDIEGIVTDAAKLELADFTVRDRQAQLARTHATRSNGTPTTPTRARKAAALTPDQQREAALDDIFGS